MEIGFGSGKKEKELLQKKEAEEKIESATNLLNNISRRYNQMNSNFENLDSNIDERNDKWYGEIEEFNDEVKKLEDEMIFIKDLNSKNLKLMENIISRFKSSAKTSDYEEASTKLDSWNVESFVTKKRFKRILLEEIEKRV